MALILDIGLGVLLALSCAGYMLIVRKLLSLPWEFVPVFVFSSIACLVFMGGLAEQLFAVSVGVAVLGLVALAATVVLRLRQGEPFRLVPSLFQATFLSGSLIFLLALFQNQLTHYDNFSHWAIVVKTMLSTDAFPTPASNLIDFKNYPLGTSVFIYYVSRFAGNAQSVMLLAQGLLIFSCFYAMFGIVTEKRRFLLYAFLGLGLSVLSYFNLTIRITNLLVDFLLPIYTLAIFAVVYRYRNEITRACLIVLPLAGLLMVMKSTGILFAAIGLLYLLYTWLTQGQKLRWSQALAVIGVIGGACLPYFGWSWRMSTVFEGVENKFEISAFNLQNFDFNLEGSATDKSAEQVQEIVALFIQSILDLETRPALGVAAFQALALGATVIALFMRKKWNLWKAALALNLLIVLYYSGILAMYLYSMPLDEALRLAGFERYASSIVVLFIGGLVMCATVDLERSFHYKIGERTAYRSFKNERTKGYYQNGIIACISIAVILLLSEYNGNKVVAGSYETSLPFKVREVTGDRWYVGGQEDNSRYLLYAGGQDLDVENNYLRYIGRFYLYAPEVEGIARFFEDNMDNLLSDFDYLVVVESDAEGQLLLKKHYDVDMQEGIYIIKREGELLKLALVN